MAFQSYITYDEYKQLGGKVSEDAFSNLERRAQRLLDYITFDRIPIVEDVTGEIPEQVKEVLTDFIDRIQAFDVATGAVSGSAKQYSNGIESITIKDNAENLFNSELANIAKIILPDYLTARMVNFDVRTYLQSDSNNP